MFWNFNLKMKIPSDILKSWRVFRSNVFIVYPVIHFVSNNNFTSPEPFISIIMNKLKIGFNADLHGLVSQWLLPFMMTNQMVSYFYIFIFYRTFIIFFWWLDLWFSVDFSNLIFESKINLDGKFKSFYL